MFLLSFSSFKIKCPLSMSTSCPLSSVSTLRLWRTKPSANQRWSLMQLRPFLWRFSVTQVKTSSRFSFQAPYIISETLYLVLPVREDEAFLRVSKLLFGIFSCWVVLPHRGRNSKNTELVESGDSQSCGHPKSQLTHHQMRCNQMSPN